MKTTIDIRQTALRTIALEAEAVQNLARLLTDDFDQVVDVIARCSGRIVVSGIGKSAIIAQKIVATFNSTGTPSVFLHAADAIHGDLGIVQQQDVVIIISKSGESPEIKVLVPLIRNFGNPVVAIVGHRESFLATHADYVLDTTVSQEACPNNLAPTSSTTVQLVMGDCLAVCLMERRGFEAGDFAKLHPGGALGKKLYLRVSDLSEANARPCVAPEQSLMEAITVMTKNRLGVTVVVDSDEKIVGVITDGDLRRLLERRPSIEGVRAADIMTPHPRTVEAGEMAVNALDLMRQNNITQLVVVEGGRYTGIVHLHDLIREGLI